MGTRPTRDGHDRTRLRHPVLVLLLAAGALLVVVAGASAPAPAAGWAEAGTDPTGAHVVLGRDRTWAEVPARSGPGGGTPEACVRRWVPAAGEVELRPTPAGDYRTIPIRAPRPGPEFSVYHVWCSDLTGDHYLGSVWLRPEQFGVDPRAIAERLVRDLPFPAAGVGANPAGRGLTGLASWFWVEGYTAAPITETVRAFGLTVSVEATPESVSWDFGDGTTAPGGGLGTPPPGRSDVQHVFETRGRPTLRVRALIRLAVRWRVGAGPWEPLAPVVRTAVLDYPVVESRSVLVPAA
jgi:hypothetical protein